MSNYFEFLNTVKIMCGENATEKLSSQLDFLNSHNPMLITDNGIIKAGLKDKLMSYSRIDFKSVYSDVPQDSSLEIISDIVKLYVSDCCDGIVALGGGSVIDTSKAVRLQLQNDKPISELMGYESAKRGKNVPFVVIPTTSGTGSECTMVAVIADTQKNTKLEFITSEMLPDIAILDSRFTVGLPLKATITTALDALCHAIEAYTCLQHNPITDSFALSAIEIITHDLPKVVFDTNNLTLRTNIHLASNLAGIAFSNSMVGLVHAIGHALGGVCHIPHGNAMAMLMPAVFEYNKEVAKDRYSKLAIYFAGENRYINCPENARAELFISELKQFINQFCQYGLQIKLSEYNVEKSQFDNIAIKAINDGAMLVNPEQATKEDIINILNKIY